MGITYSPLLPEALLWFLAVAGSAALVPGLALRARGSVLRAFAALFLFLLLTGPGIDSEIREPVPDVAALIVDQSWSQRAAGRDAEAREVAATVEAALAGQSALELRTRYVAGEALEAGTNLFDAARDMLADVPADRTAGVILITDGQVHDVPADTVLASWPGPVHALITGNPDRRDRAVHLVDSPGFGVVGGQVTFSVRVTSGDTNSLQIPLEARVDGDLRASRLVEPGRETDFTLDIDHAGDLLVRFSVPLETDEISADNNAAFATVRGIRDRLRVLLISGEPNAGERNWRNLLRADPSVDLIHFTILRPPEKQDFTPIDELSLITFPTRELFEERLGDFDLVIFDRYRRRGVLPLAYMDNIVRYIVEGGAVLLAAGPDFATPQSLYWTGLGDVLPATPTGTVLEAGFRPATTATGRRHPVTRGLDPVPAGGDPWGRWFRMVDSAASGGEILMTGPGDSPLLLLNDVGEGRVAQLLSDQSWLWHRGFEGGGPQLELLRRLSHWLMKEPDLEAERLVASIDDGELLVTRHTLDDDPEPVEIRAPTGEVTRLDLEAVANGRYSGRFAAASAGVYRLQQGDHETFAVTGSALTAEARDLVATDVLLSPAIDGTGGAIHWTRDSRLPSFRRTSPSSPASGYGWLGLRSNGAYDVTGSTRSPLLPALPAALLLFAPILFAWYREGR